MQGWVKLHRKLLKSRAWCGADSDGKVILITLLLMACHTVTKWQVTSDKDAVLNPGELFISYRKFAQRCGVTTKKLRSELNRLTVAGFLERKSKAEGTVVHVVNWDEYQLPDTPAGTVLGTLSGTVSGTPQKPDVARDYAANSSASETLLGTVPGTVLGTQNKNYILLINKLNKNDINKKLLDEVSAAPDFVQALTEYNGEFPTCKHNLQVEILQALKAFAVTASPRWVLQAVRELKAANKGKVIRNPQNYLLGILCNWLDDGLPNTRRSAEAELEDFYRKEGIL